MKKASFITWSYRIDGNHRDNEAILYRVVQHGSVSCYQHCVIFSTGGYGDIVAQDRYPLQSEGRTPGDEDSTGVERSHGKVTD